MNEGKYPQDVGEMRGHGDGSTEGDGSKEEEIVMLRYCFGIVDTEDI